jgi:hypothetical protein
MSGTGKDNCESGQSMTVFGVARGIGNKGLDNWLIMPYILK